MNTEGLTTSRERARIAAVATGLLCLLTSCSDGTAAGIVTYPRADAGGVGGDGGARDSGERFCNSLQCRQMEFGPGLPPTSIRGIVYDPAGMNPLFNDE